MANPTKTELLSVYSDMLDTIESSPIVELTDTQIAASYAGTVDLYNNIDPSKKVKVKHIVDDSVISFE